jgi:hypothetical protein
MSLDELLKHVPPEVIYRRVPLPDEKNALGPWRQAVTKFVKPENGSDEEDLWGTLIYGEGKVGEAKPKAFPAGDEGKPLRELLEKNREALELLEEGIRRGRLQLPETRWPSVAAGQADLAWQVVDLSQGVLIKAKALCTDRDFRGAAAQLIDMLHMGEMICNAEGDTGDYLAGEWIRESAQAGIRSLAARKEVPGDVLSECLAAIDETL